MCRCYSISFYSYLNNFKVEAYKQRLFELNKPKKKNYKRLITSNNSVYGPNISHLFHQIPITQILRNFFLFHWWQSTTEFRCWQTNRLRNKFRKLIGVRTFCCPFLSFHVDLPGFISEYGNKKRRSSFVPIKFSHKFHLPFGVC